jgi:hypothetical protein
VNLLIVTLVTPSLASEGIFLNISSARKVVTELQYGDVVKQRLFICQQQYSTSKSINTTNETLIIGLNKDKVVLTGVSEEFEKRLLDTNKQLIAEKESKPSRFVWYGVGFITAVILGLVGAFLVAK